MPNIYEQMLMGDATDQAKMKMAAAALRRRERFGTLAAMTGDKMLAPWGQAQLEDIQSKASKMMTAGQQGRQVAEQRAAREQREGAALRSHGLDKAKQAWAEEKFGRQPYMGPAGNVYTEGEGWVDPPANIAEQKELDRQAKIDAAAAGRSHGLETWYAKENYKATLPSKGDSAKGREGLAITELFNQQAEDFGKLKRDIPPGYEAAANLVRGNGFLSWLAPAIERAGFDTDQIRAMAEGRLTEAEQQRIISGLQLTAVEIENFKKFSPWAENISNDERIQRMEYMANAIGRKASSKLKQTWEDVDYSQWLSNPENPEMNVGAAPTGLPAGWAVKVK